MSKYNNIYYNICPPGVDGEVGLEDTVEDLLLGRDARHDLVHLGHHPGRCSTRAHAPARVCERTCVCARASGHRSAHTAHIKLYLHAYARARAHTHTHTHTQINTHTHTHTHTHGALETAVGVVYVCGSA